MKRITKILTMSMVIFLIVISLTSCNINVSGKSYHLADYSYKYTKEGQAYVELNFNPLNPNYYVEIGMSNPFNHSDVFFYSDGYFMSRSLGQEMFDGNWSDIGDSIKVDIVSKIRTGNIYEEYVGKTIYFNKTINGLKLDVLKLEPELCNHFTKLEYIYKVTGEVR